MGCSANRGKSVYLDMLRTSSVTEASPNLVSARTWRMKQQFKAFLVLTLLPLSVVR